LILKYQLKYQKPPRYLPTLAVCAKSRTGYVITLGETTVLWGSKLQTKIALSTTWSEYTALSTAMRDVLPLRRLIDQLASSKQERLTIMTIVWEDNEACRILANSGDLAQITPRNNHFAKEMHWFREHIQKRE
jgi:hypothetical protein